MILAGLSANGTALGTGGGSVAPLPTSPSQVLGLATGSPSTATIPVTYMAADGTAPIVYAGLTAPHGSTTFTANSGTFTATGGTFTGLAAGTGYDLRIVATNAAGSSTTTLTTGVSTSAPPVVVVPTGTANRIDVTLAASAVAVGTAVSISVIPNALWPTAGGKTVTLLPSNGDPAIVLTAPTSGGAALTGSYTPTKTGEVSLAVTNTAGLYDPYPAPLTVFASSAGTARTISAALTRNDMVTYQRDTASGNPAGFSLAWARGWGEVWLDITAIGGQTTGLFIRLYDAQSNGATTIAGTGTALHSSAVQVYGVVGVTGVARVLLPAGPFIYFGDVATDAAFTNPIRIAQRFRVGVVIGHFSRSQQSGLSRSYPYTNNVPLPTSYKKTATWVGFDYRYQDYDSGWYMHDGVTADPYQDHYSEGSSSGAQEIGRLIESQLGVCVGIAGSSATGGGLDAMVNHDGSLAGGFAQTVAAAVGSKFRYFWMATGGWDAVDSNYPSETQAEVRTRFMGAVASIAATFPSCGVIGWCAGASGIFGNDGSRALGYTRNQMIVLNEIEPLNPMVVSKEDYNWNEYDANHATMSARVDYVRPSFRKLMAAELAVMGGFQTAARGPVLAAAGIYNAGTRTIDLGYTLPAGAAGLQTIGLTYSNPNPVTVNGATSQEIAGLFAVYGPGGSQGTGLAIKIASATINGNAKTITLALTGASGVTFADGTTGALPPSFNVHFAADFGASNGALSPGSGRSAVIADDRIDAANGIPYGWHMLPALDIPVPVS